MSHKQGSRGGKRAGAGRPKGSTNALGLGEVRALKALRFRVPDGTHEALADVAGEALETIVSVMRGRVGFQEAGPVLRAAAMVREEVCGQVAQKHEVSGKDGGALVVEVRSYADEAEE